MEVKYVKLGEQCSKIGSGATPKGGSSVYVESGVSLIRSQNVYNLQFSYSGLAHINDSAANKLKGVTVKKDDVLLNITGDSVARTCVVPDNVLPARVNQHVAIIRPKKDVDSWYLNYYLASPAMQGYLLNIASTGASRNAITKAMIEKLVLPLPSLEIQHRIASILSAYDNLIENNNKRIRLLEQMAENLYKEWFAYHRIKDSVKDIRLTDIVSYSRGLSYSSEEIDCEDGNDLINLKNIQAFGGFRLDGTKKYDGQYKEEQVVKEGDLIMGVTDMTQDRRTVGSVALIPNISNLSVISADLIKLNSDIDNVYLYAMFRWGNVSKYISQFANGANVLHLRPQVLKNIKVMLPHKTLIEKYVLTVKPMIETINKLNTENESLTRQRDLLLPRLMSGKLEVK